MKILLIAGARPNFMKVAPLYRALARFPGVIPGIIHTGQHYDENMSEVFFRQLELPAPDHYLGIGSGTPTQQIARIMLRFEEVLEQDRPDRVVVVGDVNSTLACALAAAKKGVPVAHVEAGLRSGDAGMPEELNRVLTDRIADQLFATEQMGVDNLLHEGIEPEKIYLAGNVMIDSLVSCLKKADALHNLDFLGLSSGEYVLMTMHRPSNVDHEDGIRRITRVIEKIVSHKKVVFPVHPRVAGKAGAWRNIPGVILLEPQGYLEFLNLLQHAFLVITDSGGIQEETTYLGIPCFTFRRTTERPVTVTMGTNYLCSDLDPHQVYLQFLEILAGKGKKGGIPPLWDGKAADRIASHLLGVSH